MGLFNGITSALQPIMVSMLQTKSTLYHVYLEGGQHGDGLDIIEFFFHTMT
jgi:hypothetical protein